MTRYDDSILRPNQQRSIVATTIKTVVVCAMLCVCPQTVRAQFLGPSPQTTRQFTTQQQGRAATNAAQNQAIAQAARQRQAQQQAQAQQRQPAQNQRQTEQRKTIFSGLFGGMTGGAASQQRPKNQPNPNANANAQRRPLAQQPAPTMDRRGTIPQSSNDFHRSAQHLPVGAPQAARESTMDPEALTRPSSDPRDAREALAKLPRDVMPQATYEKLQSIAANASVYRRLPMGGCRCNPELFDYFLSYPNAVVELWKHMGYNEIDMQAMGNDRYILSERNGSRGDVQVIYQDSETTIVYANGNYRAPAMLRAVEGEAFFILQTRYTEDAALTPIVICRLDGFIKIKNPGVDFLARTFNATVGKIADANFEQTLAFIDSVSQTVEQNPIEFQNIASSLRGLSPEARSILSTKAYEIGRQAAARSQGQLVNYRLLAKRNAPNPGYARILSRGDANYGEYLANSAPRSNMTDPNALPSSLATMTTSGAPGFASSSRPLPNQSLGGGDFSLSNDDFESSLEWGDDEEMMTGEEFLMSQSGSSLAKVGAKPSTKPLAINALEANERDATPALPKRGTALSTESFQVDDDDSFNFDDEPVIESEAASDAQTNAFATSKRPPLFPPSAHAPRLNSNAAQPSQEEPIESEQVAEISFGEDGSLELDFFQSDEEPDDLTQGGENEEIELQPLALDSTLQKAEQTAPYAESLQSEEIQGDDEALEEIDATPQQPVDSWTRATLPISFQNNPPLAGRTPLKNAAKQVEKAAKKAEKSAKKIERKIKDAIEDEDRPRFITRRYEPLKFKALDSKGNSTQNSSQQGEPVSNYKQVPTQSSPVVAKTAALDNESEPKTATFKKPEVK